MVCTCLKSYSVCVEESYNLLVAFGPFSVFIYSNV